MARRKAKAKQDRVTEYNLRKKRTRGRWRVEALGESDSRGLYLQVTEQGSRSWVLRYRSPTLHDAKNPEHGRDRWLGLGPVGRVPLSKARELAAEARKLVDAGTDPIEQAKKQRADAALQQAQTITFAEAANR